MSIPSIRRQLASCALALIPWLASSASGDVVTTVGVTYDVAAQVDTLTLPSGRVVSHTYAEGAILETTSLDGTPVVAGTELTVLAQPSRTTLAVSHGSPGGEILRTYDALGRLASHEIWFDDESVPDYRASNFQYDAWGFVSRLDRMDLAVQGTLGYGYDGQGRLETMTVAGQPMGYTYDAAGNLLARSGLTSGGLEVPATGAAVFDSANRRVGWSYDAEGRLTEDDRYRYRYDRAGRLAALFDLQDNLVAHYLYDADGRRVRTVDDTSMTVTTRDLSGGVVDVRKLDLASGATVEQRESVLHGGQPVLEVVTAEGSTTYEHSVADRLGNPVVRRVDGQRRHQEYSPYGLQVLAGQPEHRGAHGFTGSHEDDASGLVYMQARYYDPTAGRFQRPDPARDFDLLRPSTLNLYQYTYGNPVNHVDPDGLRVTLLIRDSSGDSAVHHAALRIRGGEGEDAYDYTFDFGGTKVSISSPGELRLFENFEDFKASQADFGELTEFEIEMTDINGEALPEEEAAKREFRMAVRLLNAVEREKEVESTTPGARAFRPEKKYNLFTNNCLQTCTRFLQAEESALGVKFTNLEELARYFDPRAYKLAQEDKDQPPEK